MPHTHQPNMKIINLGNVKTCTSETFTLMAYPEVFLLLSSDTIPLGTMQPYYSVNAFLKNKHLCSDRHA